MAREPNDDEDQDLDTTDNQDADDADQGGDDDGDSDGDDDSGDDDDQGDDDTLELTVQFEGDDATDDQPDDSKTIRKMREELRRSRAELAEARKSTAPKAIEVGDKPTLASCDFDEDQYDVERDAWQERKAAAERQTEETGKRDAEISRAWEADLTSYRAKTAQLAAPDFDEAEEAVKTDLDLVQQAVIVKAAHDPAAMVYALGKSDAKRAELAKIKDPIKLAAAVARMEATVKVTRGKRAPAPDRPATGSASMPGGADKQLEKLEKDAERTGDRSKLISYKRDKKL